MKRSHSTVVAARQRRLDHPLDVVAPRREHQQRLGQRVHRLRAAPARAAARPAACRPARACRRRCCAARAQALGERLDVGRLAGAVDAFEGDEAAASRRGVLRWYRFTARLCSASVSLNSLLPSPRATKYSALVGSGRTAASSDALPGIGDRRRRQAGAGVGVVGRVGEQVALAQVAVEGGAEAVDHGRVGLQRHADAQPVDEHAGDAAAVGAGAGLLLDDRRQRQRLVGALQRRRRARARARPRRGVAPSRGRRASAPRGRSSPCCRRRCRGRSALPATRRRRRAPP